MFKLIISKGGLRGEIVYTKTYNYADTEQSIDMLQIGKKEGCEYLIYYGTIGNTKTPVVRIVAKKEGEIREISELRGWPEFADLDSNGIDEIIVSHGEFWSNVEEGVEKKLYPDSASIYSWKNGDLVLVQTVFWGKRFRQK